jgi:hypothetical protein
MKRLASIAAAGVLLSGTLTAQTSPPPPVTVAPTVPAVAGPPPHDEKPVLIKLSSKCQPSAAGDRRVTWTLELENPTGKPIGDIVYESTYLNQFGNVLAHGGGKDHAIHRVVKPHCKRIIDVVEGPIPERTANADIALVSAEFVNVDDSK